MCRVEERRGGGNAHHWLVAQAMEAICWGKQQAGAAAAKGMHIDGGASLPVYQHLQSPCANCKPTHHLVIP